MKNKGQKAGNIYAKLKSAGFTTDGASKPIIKGVGIESPLKLHNQEHQGTGSHRLSKGADGNSPANAKGVSSPLKGLPGAGVGIVGAYLAKKVYDKGKEIYTDYKSGKKKRLGVKDDEKTEGKKTTGTQMKDLALGSEGRKAEYDKRKWKYDETIKGYNKDGSEIEKKADEVEVTPTPEKEVTPKEVKIQTDNVAKEKADVTSAKGKKVTAKADLARAGGKEKKAARLDRRAARIKKRATKGTGAGNLIRKGVAAIRGKKGAAKDKAIQTQVAANEAKEKKDSPATLKKGKKSPLKDKASRQANREARKAKREEGGGGGGAPADPDKAAELKKRQAKGTSRTGIAKTASDYAAEVI
jgi:hypothetical protein